MIFPSIPAILLATAANIIIGMLWYGPLFGKQWMRLTGKKQGVPENRLQQMTFAVITALVTASVLDVAAALLAVTNAAQGALVGGIISVGFVFTTHANDVLWLDEPVQLYMLDAAHFFVSFCVMGAIVAAL